MNIALRATHVLCAIGCGTDQVWASARAGVARIGNSHVMDRHFEPIQMGLVPEEALGTLIPEIDALPLPSRARRILRLATPSLAAIGEALDGRSVPLFVGLPDLTVERAPWLAHMPRYLQMQSGVNVDRARSRVLPSGRAAALLALEQALEVLNSGQATEVVVGGIDTFLDLRLLAELDAEERILGRTVMDGFVPGEGAAFYILSNADSGDAASATAHVMAKAAASVPDPGHRYGDAPARGEGLANALEMLRQRTNALSGPIATTFAGFNGESFDGKLWGVARLRHDDFFSRTMLIEHPADKFGDAGAAMGAILVALAGKALANGTRTGPALIWACSDRELRAAAVLDSLPARKA